MVAFLKNVYDTDTAQGMRGDLVKALHNWPPFSALTQFRRTTEQWFSERGETADFLKTADSDMHRALRGLLDLTERLIEEEETKEDDQKKSPPTVKGSVKLDPKYENTIFVGPPGTGKTLHVNALFEGHQITRLQFHAGYTYEAFVQGERIVTIAGDRNVQVMDGPFMIAYRKATGQPARSKGAIKIGPDNKSWIISIPTGFLERYGVNTNNDKVRVRCLGATYDLQLVDVLGDRLIVNQSAADVMKLNELGSFAEFEIQASSWTNPRRQILFLDEINRADCSKVFGELLTALAELDSVSPQPVALQYSGEQILWPREYMTIVGTMNSSDRSIGDLDQALKRRFKFVPIEPNYKLLSGDPANLQSKFEKEQFDTLFSLKQHFGTFPGLFDEYLKNGLIDQSEREALSELGKDYDSVFKFLNIVFRVSKARSEDKDFRLPIPSIALKRLNELIESEEYEIFDAKKKLIGHSYFLKMGRRICELLFDELNRGGLEPENVGRIKFEPYKRVVDEILNFEIKPQVVSTCGHDAKVADELMLAWRSDFERSAKTERSNVPLPKAKTG